ncbi:MAG: lipoyl synthase [Deltaproteobacteria bacterium]|nr:lipoyl synthase [Deltaproteobacteria bacterium]
MTGRDHRSADAAGADGRSRLPPWLRSPQGSAASGRAVRRRLRAGSLSTVCEEARCPNIGRCFGRGTATFLVLGDRCTRCCAFCNILRGEPAPVDGDEPARLVAAAGELNLDHVVVTSVSRDDLADGGAAHFAAVVYALRAGLPAATVEVLVPDFGGRRESLDAVLAARPDVLNHNVETVARLYPRVRPQADFDRSLRLLERARRSGVSLVKSGFMVGLGEDDDEVRALLATLAWHGVQAVTVGQYLRPRLAALPVARYVEPERFEDYREAGIGAGLEEVLAGPLVRSSYCADDLRRRVLRRRLSGSPLQAGQ